MIVLKALWRFLVGVKDALVLVFLLLFFGLLWAALNTRATVTVPDRGALVLDLSGVVVDQATQRSPFELASGGAIVRETQARDVIRAIRLARDDARIGGIVLQLDTFVGGGQANLQAIAAELAAFKRAGKPIFAYASAYLDDGYALAAHATEVWVNPLGGVLLSGPGGSNLYFARALDELGVTVNVFRVGTFKAAVEPFTRQDASPEAEAADRALVGSLWRTYAADLARARPGVDVNAFLANLPARVRAANGDLAGAARAAGLVDQLGTYTALGRELSEKYGLAADQPGGFNQIDLRRYLSATRSYLPEGGPAVGVVYVAGMIVDGEAGAGTAGGDTIADLIEQALADDSIKALVVRVDSPGGSVLASERIRQALLTARERDVPVVASMGPVAASGGYWVATAAQAIYAQPATITGSIGVFAIIPTFESALAELKVGVDGVKSTPYSGDPDVLTGLTPQTRDLLQLSVEDIYRRFLGIVATARKQTPAQIDRVAQGRVWDGVTAQRLGLVDRMGGLDAAIDDARRRAELAPDSRVVDIEPRSVLPYELVASLFEDEAAPATDVIGKTAERQSRRLAGAAGGALATLRRPSVQALCATCWGWSAAPAEPLPGALDLLRRAVR